MSTIPTKQIDGDVAVGRNVSAGGDANIQGNVRVGHNLRVDGWLDARNIKGPNRGLFPTVEALKSQCPLPHAGWYALVGDTLPATVYMGVDGEWITTGKQGGNPILDTSLITIYDIGISQGYSAEGHPAKLFLYRRGEEPLSVPFPIATAEYDGFMTAAQVKELADVRSIAEGMAVTKMEFLSSEEHHTAAIGLYQGGEGVVSVSIPHATTERSGLMCRGQAIILDELQKDMSGVKESLTQAHSKAAAAMTQAIAALQLPRFSGIVVDALPEGTNVFELGAGFSSSSPGCDVIYDRSCNRFLLRRALDGNHPTYYTLWTDAATMGLTLDMDPDLPRVYRASEGVAYMATKPPYGLYFLNEEGGTLIPGSQPSVYEDFAQDVSNAITTAISGKVDKEEGKGLSSNDFTDEDKSTLDNLRCLPCYVPFSDGTLSDEQQERNRLTFEDLLSNQLDGSPVCALLNIIPIDYSFDAEDRLRSIGTLTRLTTDFAIITCISQDPGGVYLFMMDSDGSVYDRIHYQGVRSSAIEHDKLIVGRPDGTLGSTALKTINKTSLLGEGDISLGLSEEEQHTLDNLRAATCYAPLDPAFSLTREQIAANKATLSILAENADFRHVLLNFRVVIDENPDIPAFLYESSPAWAISQRTIRCFRQDLIQECTFNDDGTVRSFVSIGKYVPYGAIEPNKLLIGSEMSGITSQSIKTLNGQSLLGTGDIKAVVPEEGKGLSNVIAGALQTSDNLPDIYTCSRAQLKMDLFIDLLNAAAGTHGRYDPENAPDPKRPFLLNKLWFSYADAVEIYNWSVKGVANTLDSPYQSCRLSTVLPLRITSHLVTLKNAFRSSSLKRVSIIGPNYDNTITFSNAADFFTDCYGLEEVVCDTHILVLHNYSSSIFRNCRALREIRLRTAGGSFDIHWSPLLSPASVRSFIPPSAIQNGAVITVHPDVYAKLTGDTTNTAAAELTQEELDEWQQILLDATEKNITFATV